MFRFLLLVSVVCVLMVFMRLVLLRLKLLERKAVSPAQAPEQSARVRTIDAPQPLEVKSYMYTNFDYRTGPADREEFFENMYVNVGAAGPETNSTRTYSLYVTTPRALDKAMRAKREDYKFGRNLLVVERYDMDVILKAVREHINDLGLLGENVD
jgi:hypothetical protein